MQKELDQHIINDGSGENTANKSQKTTKVRKTFVGILIGLGVLLLLIGGAVGLLHMKSVQTYIISRITNQLAETLQADVRIAQFHYRPLSHLAIDSIYLSDQQRDTLAYIEQMRVEFQPLQLRFDRIDIQRLQLQNPYVNLHSSADSTLNIQFLVDALKRDSSYFPFRVNIDTLQLEQTRVRYNDMLVDQLDLDLALPVLSQDSLDIQLHSMHLRAQLDRIDACFETDLRGGLDSIFAQNMQLTFRNQSLFSGDIAIFNPTELGSMYVEARCNDLYCNDVLLRDLLSQLQIKPFALPSIINQLGDVHYRGNIYGRLELLNLRGSFSTLLGAIHVNGDIKSDTALQHIAFHGHVATNSFQIGKLLNHTDLGAITLQADVNGTLAAQQLVYCTAKADIHQLEYKGYNYQQLRLDAELRPQEVNGHLRINDENISLIIDGLADWSMEDTRLDMTMQLSNFKPSALHLIDQYPELALGATTYISLYTSGKGNELLDHMTGYVIIDSLQIQNGAQQTTMEQFKLLIDSDHKDGMPFHQMRVQSDYMTANLSGSFQYSTLPATIQHLTHLYLPSVVKHPTISSNGNNNLDFYAYFRNLDSITQVFDPELEFPSFPTIKGYIRESNQQIGLQAFIPQLNTSGAKMENLTIALDNEDNQLGLSISLVNHLPQNNPTAAKLGDIKTNIYLNAQEDELDLLVELGNTDSVRNEGVIHAISKLSNYNNQSQLDIQVLPSNFILNDSAWSIGQSNITYVPASKLLKVNNFALNTDYQSITVNGRASALATDSLTVTLQNINLDYLLSYTEANKVISIMGPVTGQADIYSIFSEPMLEAQAQIPHGGLNGVYLGDVIAEATLDRENKSILIHGQIVDSTQYQVAQVNGKVIPAKKWWGLDITCDSLDINFIDAWTKNIIANPQGRAYGQVKVEGQQRKVWVTGKALAKDAQVTLPQIGVTLYMSDSIFLDSTQIRFPNIAVTDKFGNKGLFTGTLSHKYFLNFQYDLRAQANKMMLMNLPANQQSFFYGQVFGTGDVHIYGDDTDCQIDVKAKTEANTKFYLNINSASQATTSDFITFVQPDTSSHYLLNLLRPTQTKARATESKSRTRLSLEGNVSPDADIIILLGGDDGIRGRGEGNLKLTYESPSENIEMQGNYTLHSGKFDYSIGNFVRRSFTIREGSQITWDRDPLAPQIDAYGYYHTTASLRDLFGSESSQIATNRTSVPVNCVLHMTDQLFNPMLSFSIELPQSDESVQSQVRSMINTDEMLMRQVIYLLVFNRFYTPDYLQNTQNVGLNETYSLLSSTITGQINSWLSKLTDVFTMGFNFRTDGEGETASQEYEANFQIHPINQLVINGNFGYRYNDLSNRPFFGDLDIEYILTENGKLRAKAFTHTVDKYSLRQANTVQGVGFVFKHDFNWKRNKNKEASNNNTSFKKRNKKQKEKL